MRGDVLITIDLAGILADMGTRALLSKGGKSVDGYVTVKALNRRHEPQS